MAYLSRFIKYALALLILGWAAQSLWFHSLPRVQLHINSRPMRVVIADTPGRQAWGLMYRIALGDGEGMLFVYSSPRKVCMWMTNTLVPLSVAFIRQDGVVASLDDMQPLTRRLHCSPTPVTYALEVPLGWFTASAVKLGTKIAGLPLPSR
jgi:uncharacterized membrane protein (UPF0127 family)